MLAIEKNAFGQILFTNIVGFDIPEAYAPLCNFTRNICSVVLCTPVPTPVVRNGEVVVRNIANLMVTFDHRYQDGSGSAHIIKGVKDVWENPEKYY